MHVSMNLGLLGYNVKNYKYRFEFLQVIEDETGNSLLRHSVVIKF